MSVQPLPPKTQKPKTPKRKPQSEDPEYAYLAHIPLEVPQPTAKPPAVVAFIAAYLIQRSGFPPETAMRKASRLKSTDGAQFYDMDLDDLNRVFGMQGEGIWMMIQAAAPWRSSGYRRALSGFLSQPQQPAYNTSAPIETSKMMKEKMSEPCAYGTSTSASASSSAVATGSLRARRWSQRHGST